jgi:hypothetical protein
MKMKAYASFEEYLQARLPGTRTSFEHCGHL